MPTLMAIPLPGLQFQHSLGYTNARYTSLVLPVNGQPQNIIGNRPVFSPDLTATIALQYETSFGARPAVNWITRGEWLYLGDQFFDLANTIGQKRYSTFNVKF